MPALERIDHIHVVVADRKSAEKWYAEVLGLYRVPELAFWSPNGGPLTIANQSGSVHLALFEGTEERARSTIAFGVNAEEFLTWRGHLQKTLGQKIEPEDHEVSWSLYFSDPDGNRFEVTSYEYSEISEKVKNVVGRPSVSSTHQDSTQ